MMSDTVNKAKPNRRWFEEERGLVLTGLLGFMLAAVCGIWTLINGGEVSPGGDVSKAFSFNAALGIFLLSTAMIMPLSAMGKRSRAWFRRIYIGLALYAYGAETIQNFRGVNPRFVENGSAFDQAVGTIFGFIALLLVLFYLYVGVQFFRSRAYKLRPAMALSIRYAMIAVTVSFAAGIWISVNQGRFTGAAGNIIWLHGFGFHALQALPIVAWLAERTDANARAKRTLIHIAGIAYLLGLVAIGWQTLNGQAILSWSALPIVAAFCFLISLAAGVVALRRAMSGPQGNQRKWASQSTTVRR